MDPRDALDLFLTNDLGVFHCTQAVMQTMLSRRQGLLVNIYGNGSFLRPATPTGLYGASKAWITSFTRSLAKEVKGSGMQVLGFSPGMLLTDMLTNPAVVGESGREMMKNFGFVLRFLAKPPKSAADALVKAVAGQRGEFCGGAYVQTLDAPDGINPCRLGKPDPNRQTPAFELRYQEAYRSKYSQE